jgi:hypothetical protein
LRIAPQHGNSHAILYNCHNGLRQIPCARVTPKVG